MGELPRPPEELLAGLPLAVRAYLAAWEARLAEVGVGSFGPRLHGLAALVVGR